LLPIKKAKLLIRLIHDFALDLQDAADGDLIALLDARLEVRQFTHGRLRRGITAKCEFPYLGDEVVDHGDPCRHNAGTERSRFVAGDCLRHVGAGFGGAAALYELVEVSEAHHASPSQPPEAL
jgi:hypothetical protein